MPITVLSVGYPFAAVAENTAGGAEQILAILDEALVVSGNRSVVIAPQGSHSHGALITTTCPKGLLNQEARSRAYREYRTAIRFALARWSPDVVHLHGLDFLEYLPDPGVPVVVTMHLPLSWYPAEVFSLSRPSTSLVCVSASQKARAPSGTGSCRVIPNGVYLDRFHWASEKGNYAVGLGRICPEKGFHIALDAAYEAGMPFVLAGQVFAYEAHQTYFETMIRPRLTGRNRFIGAVGGHRKNELLAGARCLVVPSLVDETSSLVAMESLACGTPVVAFRRGALTEIVEDGCTGFLVDTPSQMVQAILDAGQLSSSLCRERAERNFSADRMIREYLSLYHEVIAANTVESWENVA